MPGARNSGAVLGAIRRAILPTPFLPSSSQAGGAGGDQLRRVAQPDGRTAARRVDAAAAHGPDPHSFHGMSTDRDKSALKYMVEWLDACARLGVPIVGVAPQYIEVELTAAGALLAQFCAIPPPTSGFTNASVLDTTPSSQVRSTRAPRRWYRRRRDRPARGGGRSGAPTRCGVEGGLCRRVTPYLTPRTPAQVRRRDAKASTDTTFCRQDPIADYGLLDCATAEPLPDYYTALLWTKTMGWTAFAVNVAGGGGGDGGAAAPSGSTLTAPPRPSRRAAPPARSRCSRSTSRTRATLRLSNVGDVARVRPRGRRRRARLAHRVGGLLGTGVKRGSRSAPPPTARCRSSPATNLGREVTLPPTSLAWLVVPGAARKGAAASLS